VNYYDFMRTFNLSFQSLLDNMKMTYRACGRKIGKRALQTFRVLQ